MDTKHLNTEELCFYKSLLLRSEIFENELISLNYLEKQTAISRDFLIEPLKFLFANKIISFKNEELSAGYITAYKEARKKFEIDVQRRYTAGISSGGSFDIEKTPGWKIYFTDKYCDLDKTLFSKLEKEKKIKLKISEQMIGAGLSEVKPIFYFNFNLIIDKGKLKQYLDNYLDDFISNKFNSGEKYAYSKQVEDIAVAIQKLVSAGYPKEALLIDRAQIFPRDKKDVRPTDGLQRTSIFLYDFVDTVMALEREGFLEIKDIKYQEEMDKPIIHTGLIWEDPVKIKIALNDNYYVLTLRHTQPLEYLKALNEYQNFVKLKAENQELLNEKQKTPEEIEKQKVEQEEERQKILDEIYSKIDYADKEEKRGWEDKQKICGVIWRFYISGNRQPLFEIPKSEFVIENITTKQVGIILEGLVKERAITYDGQTDFIGIIPENFVDSYQKTKDIVESILVCSGEYQEPVETLEIKELDNENIKKEKEENRDKIVIRNISLNEQKYMLEINDGEDNVSFRSKKGKSGLEKETKLFKIFLHLWEFRREIGRNNNVIAKGDWVSLKNLAFQTDSNEGATYKNINRVLDKIKRFPIEIGNDNAGKYRLVIKIN